MARLQLTLGCGDYDLTHALIDGSVAPPGVDFIPLTMASPERHWRLVRGHEFDVCEFSLASYLAGRAVGLPYTAVPIFPHRRFRHSYVFVNAAAGIREPRDLAGRRVAVRTWQTTAGVWLRGILASECGLPLREVHWFAEHAEETPLALEGWRFERLPEDANLDQMVATGALDAAVYPNILPSIAHGDPRVRRLWEDRKSVV